MTGGIGNDYSMESESIIMFGFNGFNHLSCGHAVWTVGKRDNQTPTD